MKRYVALLSALVLSLPAAAATAAPAQAAAPYCGITWGSLDRTLPAGGLGQVVDVRAGRHSCFDRLVLDVSGDAPDYWVSYVPEVRTDGAGHVVPLRGGARLEVVAGAPVAPTDSWFRPDGEIVDTAGYRTFRDVAFAGSFEGNTTVGLGVRARLPFRAFTLDGPGSGSRLVVDVAHRW
jgi:hypothetical protein